jgi:hypothetical protein
MTPIACAALSAMGFYFSLGLGDQWWLAWIAPIPILWLAFGDGKAWRIFVAAWAAMALGGSSILRAYAGLLPIPVLVLAIGAPSLLFAVSVIGARWAPHAERPLWPPGCPRENRRRFHHPGWRPSVGWARRQYRLRRHRRSIRLVLPALGRRARGMGVRAGATIGKPDSGNAALTATRALRLAGSRS